MHAALLLLILPTLSLTAPLPDPCSPISYTISNYTYTSNSHPRTARLFFTFQSHFANTNSSLVEDAASAGTTCDVYAPDGMIKPDDHACATGRANLFWDLRARQEQADLQIGHVWRCGGHTYGSSTPHKFPLDCHTDSLGSMTCMSPAVEIQPEGMKRYCSTPTCK